MRKGAIGLGLALLGVAVLSSARGYASDVDDVKAAYAGYHAAIASLDLAKIGAAWSHDDTVIDKEPRSKTISIGWSAASKNYEGLIAAYADLSIVQTEGPNVRVQGDLAWSSGITKAEGNLKKGGHSESFVVDSDVFKKLDGKWLLVSHIAALMPQ